MFFESHWFKPLNQELKSSLEIQICPKKIIMNS